MGGQEKVCIETRNKGSQAESGKKTAGKRKRIVEREKGGVFGTKGQII